MSEREAEVITEQIVGRLDQVSENIEAVQSLMRDALVRNAHLALGYDSPGAYMRDRFDGALANLSAAMRREIVHELSDAGMSTRAIAPIVGVSHKTVSVDLAGVTDVTPASEPDAAEFDALIADTENDSDGLSYSLNIETGEFEPIDPTVTEHTVIETTKTVTGLDGKTYTRKPPVERRHSIVDDAYRAHRDLWAAVEKLRAIRSDDRYTRNKADILAALQPSIDLAREVFADLGTL